MPVSCRSAACCSTDDRTWRLRGSIPPRLTARRAPVSASMACVAEADFFAHCERLLVSLFLVEEPLGCENWKCWRQSSRSKRNVIMNAARPLNTRQRKAYVAGREAPFRGIEMFARNLIAQCSLLVSCSVNEAVLDAAKAIAIAITKLLPIHSVQTHPLSFSE